MADGLAAVQVVAQEDRAVGAQLVAMVGDPTLGGVAFAVLLADLLGEFRPAGGRVLLRLHELPHERQHTVVAVGDDARREHRVEVLLGLVVADVAGRALGTADRVRAMNLDAVQGDEQAASETQEGLEGALVAQGVKAQWEEVAEGIGSDAVEQVADLVVAGNALDAEEGLAVGAGGLLLHAALEVEEGGGLQEEEGEGAGSGVRQRVALVATRTGIRQGRPSGGRRPGGILKHSAYFMFREAALCQLWVGRIRSPTALENHTSDLQNPKMRIAGQNLHDFVALACRAKWRRQVCPIRRRAGPGLRRVLRGEWRGLVAGQARGSRRAF